MDSQIALVIALAIGLMLVVAAFSSGGKILSVGEKAVGNLTDDAKKGNLGNGSTTTQSSLQDEKPDLKLVETMVHA